MRLAAVFSLLLTFLSAGYAQVTSGAASKLQDAPLYRISFERREPVSGIDAPPLFKLPFGCTRDGTAFITMLPAGGLAQGPQFAPPPLLLVSVSPSGQARTFPIDQSTEQLYNSRELDHYPSDSTVVFLVEAAQEKKLTTRTYTSKDGNSQQYSDNSAERHMYLLFFDREGNHKRTLELSTSFRPIRIGIFPSGTLLAYGYSEQDHAPKLAMLKQDGTLLRFLQPEEGSTPNSIFQTKDGSGKGPAVYVAPTEFVSFGDSILLVHNKSTFPLLEVSETGSIRVIRPHLPQGVRIDSLVPSDQDLYVRVMGSDLGSIYEIDAQSGRVRRRFETGNDAIPASIACVHDGKFLSFDHGEGKLVPLVGTADPSTKADQAPPRAASK